MQRGLDRKTVRLLWAAGVLFMILLLCVAGLLYLMAGTAGDPEQVAETTLPTQAQTDPPETEPPTTTVPEETQPEETETVPEETEPAIEDQPEMLTVMLAQNGNSYELLKQQGCTQLITVSAWDTKASIQFYTCTDGLWSAVSELECQGFVGQGGVSSEKQEGDGCTPTGLYGIGSAFYIDEAPDTALEAFQITKDTYWVDDPFSDYYNQRVEGTADKDWDSAEHMISYDVYRYGFVVNYNLDAVPGAGSAIFFHIGDRPTAGCISTAEDFVLAYLAQLDPSQNPHILILPESTNEPN